MTITRSTSHSRRRTLVHPGKFNPVRIQSLYSDTARHVRLALMPGLSLFDGLVGPLAEIGIHNASTTILGGAFDSIHYCVAPPDPTRQAVIAYGDPIDAGRSYMIFGNATLGRDADRKPLVHCHAAFRREDGRVKGGHILTERCIVGPEPVCVLVTSLDNFELRLAFDPETNILLLQPFEERDHD
ncbi:PPC domain-containing DNA-binding protein [Oceanibacterium hippocampi]|uniref:PPC domain-containing protein n=1 Tax=Oceanibacterium hippocampi TaxID=745714 RepID=A0A1Y5U2L7_9PROT|nr:DUF296 domain-containing protein [Oceanibacterium hippocampi]SLN75674.1 hypothetical protein OCH7691_03918 [Oceanibacterium hippocampi]